MEEQEIQTENLILGSKGNIVRYKTLVDGTVRVEIDLDDVTRESIGALFELKNIPVVSVTITTPETTAEVYEDMNNNNN